MQTDSTDDTKSYIHLKNSETNQEVSFVTLVDKYRSFYYHPQYQHGVLYFIRQSGGGSAYFNQNLTQGLWMYKEQWVKKLHSARSLDFQLSPDGKLLAVIASGDFVLMDSDGSILKIFKAEEVGITEQDDSGVKTIVHPSFFTWTSNIIWLENTQGPGLLGLVKINANDFSATKYDLLNNLPNSSKYAFPPEYLGAEYAVNIRKEKVALSNFPALFVVDEWEGYQRSRAKVYLRVYDLKSKRQELISTSITKKFHPAWIDENTLEYDNPNGKGRTRKLIF